MKNRKLLFLVLLLAAFALQAQTRWQIQNDGSIVWNIDKKIPHFDHIEMSGEQVSTVIRYGVDADGSFKMERSMVWPMLRTIPNVTVASLMHRVAIDFPSTLIVDGLSLTNENVKFIKLDGRLTVVSHYSIGNIHFTNKQANEQLPVIELTRTVFPSTDKPMLCERYAIKNTSGRAVSVNIPKERLVYHTDKAKGVDGSYTIVAAIVSPDGVFNLQPNDEIIFEATVQAFKDTQAEMAVDVAKEELARKAFVNEMWTNLVLQTPNPVINTAFAFAKIRAAESIYKTKGGYLHGPGGEAYYAAIWANDQAEYVNPLFPFLGYKTGNESAFNSFKHFAAYMNSEYKPIPSSIISEGIGMWNGAGDRGDGAMIAYGAARYALAKGDKLEAEQMWALIEWCLQFCKSKLIDGGVVASDSDELENRFPAGKANLCTSSLYYDALISAAHLAKELGKPSNVSKMYLEQSKELKKNIEKYFGANVEGFDTYRYYEGNDILRSWICIPLTVGIYERKEGTIEALFSSRLWTKDGLLTQAGTETYWDRSTLYALRGVYAAGEREKGTQYLDYYSNLRLLGDHVPYAIEAWPEGNQRHLSAESGLYCRILTEGLFGIRPTGLRSFDITPQLPDGWDKMEIKNIRAFGTDAFDILVTRVVADKIKISIVKKGKTIRSIQNKNGQINTIKL